MLSIPDLFVPKIGFIVRILEKMSVLDSPNFDLGPEAMVEGNRSNRSGRKECLWVPKSVPCILSLRWSEIMPSKPFPGRGLNCSSELPKEKMAKEGGRSGDSAFFCLAVSDYIQRFGLTPRSSGSFCWRGVLAVSMGTRAASSFPVCSTILTRVPRSSSRPPKVCSERASEVRWLPAFFRVASEGKAGLTMSWRSSSGR